MDLPEFIETYKDAIARQVINSYPPLYRQAQDRRPLPTLLRQPMGLQEDAIRGASLSMTANKGTTVVGEMGTGKTFIAIAAADMAEFNRPLVLCPPHLTRKWKREVEITLPNTKAAIVSSITDLERLRAYPKNVRLFTIMSREKAKLSYRWKPSYLLHYPWGANRPSDSPHPGMEPSYLTCPQCFKLLADNEGIPLDHRDLSRKRLFCPHCQGSLWTADHSGPARYPLADYVNRQMPGFFDLLIADEFHEFKAKGSAQGIAAGTLAEACGTSLTLTGTLMGGYASTLFHLLFRFSPDVRTDFGYHDESRWVSRYGFIEKRFTEKDSQATEHGRSSRRKSYNTRIKEIPGITPASLFHLIPHTIFLRLSDVTAALPPYDEQVSLSRMDTTPSDPLPSQHQAYRLLSEKLKAALDEALANGSMHLLGIYLQALLAYPDACMKGETVTDPLTGDLIAQIPPLPENRLYPKEQALIDLVRQERANNRRVLVYVTHTETRDITERLQKSLAGAGLSAAVLKASSPKSEHREQWLLDKVASGVDAVIANPRLVQTGLDLIHFPTIAWFETDYSVYTMRQASRRSWRIGQTKPVKVIYMAYTETIQDKALALIAKKMKTSLAMEGELPEEGLSAFGDDGKDLMYTLARRMLDADTPQDDSLFGMESASTDAIDRLLAEAQQANEEADSLLVDAEWRLPPLPTPTGPPLIPDLPPPDGDPRPGTDPLPEPEPTPQHSLFPLEDFIAQGPFTMKTKKGSKPQPAYSLFDWAIHNQP